MNILPVLLVATTVTHPLISQEQGDRKETFGGPESVSNQLEQHYDLDHLQVIGKPYFDWKKQLYADTGFKFGMWTSTVYANASAVMTGEEDAFGTILRLQGSWDAVGRNTPSHGSLNFRIEHRTALGGFIDPGTLSGAVGAGALNTGFPYSDSFDTDLAVISWKQVFNDTWGFDVGRLAFDVYQDAFYTQTVAGGFLNRSFIVNPAIGTAGVGALGAVVKGYVNDNVWFGGQAYDANAVNGEFDLDTIGEGEFLKSIEVGYTPDRARRRTDRVQLTLWHKDDRELAGAPSGAGWALSTSWKFDEFIPFARFGASDGGGGAQADAALAVGVEFTPVFDHVFSFGLGWADMANDTYGADAANEALVEASWRWQISPNFQLMPDVQYLRDPANNPASDSETVYSVRAILEF